MKFSKKTIFILILFILIIVITPFLFKLNYLFFYKQLSIIYLISGATLQIVSLMCSNKKLFIIPSCLLLTVGLLLQIKFFIDMHHVGVGFPLYGFGLSLGIFQYYFIFCKKKFLFYLSIFIGIFSLLILIIGSLKVLLFYLKINAFFPILFLLILSAVIYFFYSNFNKNTL